MPALGIDLGTTNSCVAVFKTDHVEVLQDLGGQTITPSMVAVRENGETVVGWPAKRDAELNPAHTYRSVKRLIGRAYDDPETARMREKSAFEICAADNGEAWILGRQGPMPPAQISGLVLAKLRKAAERALGQGVTKAVITTPAFFNDAQRKATRDAAQVAGLEVLRIVNEPTAAAIAAEIDSEGEKIVAVYDLGGGTFDLSVLRAGGGEFEVLSSNGDTFLGGDDFNARLIDWAAGLFQVTNGIDLRKEKLSLQRLADEAERVKVELSEAETAHFKINFAALAPIGELGQERAPLHIDYEISRSQFEAMTQDLIDRTIECCRNALADAELEAGQIDELLLVGGMTRAPAVAAAAQAFFPGVPCRAPDPDQIVARGAAILAASIIGETSLELKDVTPHAIGLELPGGVFEVWIPAQSPIPAQRKRACTTIEADQGAVTVRLRQGNAPAAADNLALGEFHLEGIRPGEAGGARVDVTVDIDVDGIVTASAKDRATGRSNNITADPAGLAPKAVQRLAKAARAVKMEAVQ